MPVVQLSVLGSARWIILAAFVGSVAQKVELLLGTNWYRFRGMIAVPRMHTAFASMKVESGIAVLPDPRQSHTWNGLASHPHQSVATCPSALELNQSGLTRGSRRDAVLSNVSSERAASFGPERNCVDLNSAE
jgi:hypothetical protein